MIRSMVRFLVLAWVLFPVASAVAQNVSFSSQPTLIANSTIPGRTSVPNDINGDGLSELLWFSPGTNQLQIWYLSVSGDQTTLTHTASSYSITPGYVVAATGDLFGDGRSDLIFTSSNLDLYVWRSNGLGHFISSYIGTYPAGWVLLGSADINGDGTDDLLWQNPSTCQFGYWLMKAGKEISAKAMPVDCNFIPLSIGYYSLTNRASITWMDAAHDLYVWDSMGSTFNQYPLGSFPATDYAYRMGGGHQGSGMTFRSVTADNSGFAFHDFVRNFSIDGRQSSWTRGTFGDGGKSSTEYSAGFVVRAQGFDNTAPVTFDSSVLNSSGTGTYPRALVCVPSNQAYDLITLEQNRTCALMQPDQGFFPVGYHAVP